MSQLNLRRFADVDFLKTIGPIHLRRFFTPYTVFLREQGVNLEGLENEEAVDALASTLAGPVESLPQELVDALCAIREQATDAGMDALVREFHARGILLPEDGPLTSADVAILAWLDHRDLFDHCHCLARAHRIRSLIVNEGMGRPGLFRVPDETLLSNMAQALNERWRASGRGKGCWIQACAQGEEWFFHIRRGEPFRREGCLKEDGLIPSTVLFRPQVNDYLYYNPKTDEIRYNLPTKGVREAVLHVFGEMMFSDPGYFTWGDKYTLEPLRRDGVQALVCSDVPGMTLVQLYELLVELDSASNKKTTYHADDVFEAYGQQGAFIPAGGRLIKAKFRVQFTSRKETRVIMIQPPCKTMFNRDGDAPIAETWMQKRGFLKKRNLPMEEDHVVSA